MDELSHEVAVARRTGDAGVVLMLDLDRFKDINDSLGHMAGDNLLVRVAELLRDAAARDRHARPTRRRRVRPDPAPLRPTEARAVSERLLGALSAEAVVKIAGSERHVTASIGIAPYGADTNGGADELLVEADLAMYRASRRAETGSRSSTTRCATSSPPACRSSASCARRCEADQLEALLPADRFDGRRRAGRLRGALRWYHPTRGMVPPDEFIPIAEEHGPDRRDRRVGARRGLPAGGGLARTRAQT